jgi:hypothetical protein
MVLACSDRISLVPPYSCLPIYIIRVRDYHPLRSHFPNTFHSYIYGFWALPLSLATTYGITIVLFSSGYLDVSVLRVISRLAVGLQVFNLQGCPIRTSMDLRSFATPHSFSQLTTSFVVSESLGIHHTPLFASCSFFLFHFPLSQVIAFIVFLLFISLPSCQRTFIVFINSH